MNNHLRKQIKYYETDSIQEFADVFVNIDEQILQLHQCSSDDFLGLNADFKQYYRQAKAISENATQIFNALTETETKSLLHDLQKLYKDLKHIQLHFTAHLDNSIQYLREIGDLQGKLFIPIKNLNQDLLTLKFLLANLKISNSTMEGQRVLNLEKIFHQYNEVINDFKICSFQNESNINALKDYVARSLKLFVTISEKNLYDLEIILNNIHYAIILFAEKHEEVSRQVPELTEKTENSSSSIAEIITNLQYHDIIRQKMEHVQATHKKLLDDLMASANEQGDENDEKRKRLLVRIRDIANLQSAQLVYANKEYQQAIEVITDKFISISGDMTTIAEMCQDINTSQENSDELYLQKLLDKLNNSSNVLNRFLDASQHFDEHIETLTTQIANTGEGIRKFEISLDNLKSVTAKTLELFVNTQGDDEELAKSLKQVENLYRNVEKYEGVIIQVFMGIENVGNKLIPTIDKNYRETNKDGLFVKTAQSMSSIINQLNQKYLLIKSLTDENLTISRNIYSDVGKSINKIRYYDFFEKVIVDIISEFNHIYQLLKNEIDIGDDAKEENLDSIRSRYTMASEHKIHDKVAQGTGDVDLFAENMDKPEEDDDNLELF